MLSILMVIKDILETNPTKEISRKEFFKNLNQPMEINPNFGEDLSEMEWETIRNTKKAMWRKYCKNKEEEDSKKYNNFVKLARAYWKLTMGE